MEIFTVRTRGNTHARLWFWSVVWIHIPVTDIVVHSLFSVRIIPYCQHCFWYVLWQCPRQGGVCDAAAIPRAGVTGTAEQVPQGAATMALRLVT